MFYLLTGISNIILNVSKVKPSLIMEEGLPIWKFADGSGLLDQDFTCVEVERIPNGAVVNKYCYGEGKFVLNPDYKETQVTFEQFDELYVKSKIAEDLFNVFQVEKVESELELDYRLSLIELGLA